MYLHDLVCVAAVDFDRERKIGRFDSVVRAEYVLAFDSAWDFPALDFVFEVSAWEYLKGKMIKVLKYD